MRWLAALALFLGLSITGLAAFEASPVRDRLSGNPDYNPNRAHHTPDGFRNPDGTQVDKSYAELWRWRREQVLEDLPKPPAADFLSRIASSPDARDAVRAVFAVSQSPAQPSAESAIKRVSTASHAASLTWIGHASMALRQEGEGFLIDPVFSERVSPVSFAGPKRKVPLAVSLSDFSSVNTVLISHNHYDHLDEPTILALLQRPEGQPRFVVPLGVDRWLRERGAKRVHALDWWEVVQVGPVSVHLVPAQHWSTRSLWDRNRTLWGGFVLESASFRFYYSGDTAYSRVLFDSIRQRFGAFDLAAIPVGAYAPRWFMSAQHTDPAEAVQAMLDLNAREGIGVHWGSFELASESLDAPLEEVPRALAAAGLARDRLALFRHAETRHYAGRSSVADASGPQERPPHD